jgi:hypothetical protein
MTPQPPKVEIVETAIPASLRQLARWLCWRWEYRGTSLTKPPYQANGQPAKSTDPTTWTTLAEALAAYHGGTADGIGIALGPADGLHIAGVDLDDCRDPQTGTLTADATWIVGRLNTYAEVSPSGRGVKMLMFGELPPGKRADHKRGIELYAAGRYFTVTGQHIDGTPADLQERTQALRELHQLVMYERNGDGEQLDERALALSALFGLSAQRAVGYQDWLAVGMALHSVDPSSSMLEAWDQWSRAAPDKYNEGECARKWRSFAGGQGRISLGSLLYWARQDGWHPPRRQRSTLRNGHPSAGAHAVAANGSTNSTRSAPPADAEEIILQWLRDTYQPLHRRGGTIWSESFGREVRRTEAIAAPSRELVELIMRARDCPRDEDGRPARRKVPRHYRDWAPSAWEDLLASLPEEDQAAEISPTSAEQLRARLMAALSQMVTLAHRSRAGDGTDLQQQERRSIIGWCALLAKPGRWSDVRTYRIWCRIDDGRLRVAFRRELWTQIPHAADLAAIDQRRLADLCRVYELGNAIRVRGGKERAIELSQDLIADLLDGPAEPEPLGQEPGQEG